MGSAFLELVGECASQPPNDWRQGFHGDAVSPQLDRAEQRLLVGAAQLHWAGRADGLERGPDRLRVLAEVADLVEETVAARPRKLNDIARCGDRYSVEAFRHGTESMDGVSDRFSVDALAGAVDDGAPRASDSAVEPREPSLRRLRKGRGRADPSPIASTPGRRLLAVYQNSPAADSTRDSTLALDRRAPPVFAAQDGDPQMSAGSESGARGSRRG